MRVSTVAVALLLPAGMVLSAFGLSQFDLGAIGRPRTWAQAGGFAAFAVGTWTMILCGQLLWRRVVRQFGAPEVEAGSD